MSMSLRSGDGFPTPTRMLMLSVDEHKNEIVRQASDLARQVGG